jgi:hypothetical protein
MCAGIAQLVEHDLAKVGVASSSLVSRSSFKFCAVEANTAAAPIDAGWQSGYAADCKSVNAGSIPTSASIIQKYSVPASPDGETGRRKGLKIPRRQLRAGSIPAPGTTDHAASNNFGYIVAQVLIRSYRQAITSK